MYLENRLAEPGGITLNGVPVDLGKIDIPIFLQSSKEDHIAPYPSVYKATQLYSGPVTFMLAGSGHIAGVINPPEANKYYYYSNTSVPPDVEDWIARRTFTKARGGRTGTSGCTADPDARFRPGFPAMANCRQSRTPRAAT